MGSVIAPASAVVHGLSVTFEFGQLLSHLVLLLKLCIICVIHFVIVFSYFILLSSPLASDVSLLPCVSCWL